MLTKRPADSVEPVRLSPSVILNKSDLPLIYAAARNRQLGEGEAVLTDKLHSCLILSGSVSVVLDANPADCSMTIGAGNWLGSCQAPWTFVAQESTNLLELSPAAFRTLAEKLQVPILQSISDSTQRAFGHFKGYAARLSLSGIRQAQYIDRIEQQQTAILGSSVVSRYLLEIPQLPQYATDLAIVKLLYDEANVQEVVDGIRQDPSLAGLVLKTVNSPYYGLPTSIADYYRACLLLGFNSVYRLVMDTALHSIMPDTDHFRAIQLRSFLVSLISQEIAGRCRKTDVPIAATIGLLHDIGNGAGCLLMRTKHPEAAPLLDVVHTAQVGGYLLKKWGLPERLVTVIAKQSVIEYQSPSQFPAEIRTELCTSLSDWHSKAYADLLHDRPEQEQNDGADLLVAALGFTGGSYLGTYQREILPALADQKKYLPETIRMLLPDPA